MHPSRREAHSAGTQIAGTRSHDGRTQPRSRISCLTPCLGPGWSRPLDSSFESQNTETVARRDF